MSLISKSKFLSGLQCHKLLWTQYNAKDRIPSVSPSTQAIFDQGHLVGSYAKQLYPDGIEIGQGLVRELEEELFIQTQEALKERKPLFEAALSSGQAFTRADILIPVGNNQWDLIEVKSTTEVKDIHIDDLAFQRYAFEGAGIRLRNCCLMHVNNKYVRNGDVDPRQLFSMVDVTDLVEHRLPDVGELLRSMIEVINADEPDIPIGTYCEDPYTCPLYDYCRASVPQHSVFELYRFGKKAYPFYYQGIKEIQSIPSGVRLSEQQRIQMETVLSSSAHIDKDRIASFLNTLRYPIYFLDFETFNTAIPLLDGIRPYQQTPFQFSLHVLEAEGADPMHHSFLAYGATDPRPDFLMRLKNVLGTTGSVVVYNAAFEKMILRQSASTFPEYQNWYESILPRIVDLLAPFRSFAYYHPDQHGSASIKKVLPVLTGTRYEGDIADGNTASNEFLRVNFSEVPDNEKQSVRNSLEAYCGLDTMAMVMIVGRLKELVDGI